MFGKPGSLGTASGLDSRSEPQNLKGDQDFKTGVQNTTRRAPNKGHPFVRSPEGPETKQRAFWLFWGSAGDQFSAGAFHWFPFILAEKAGQNVSFREPCQKRSQRCAFCPRGTRMLLPAEARRSSGRSPIQSLSVANGRQKRRQQPVQFVADSGWAVDVWGCQKGTSKEDP